jgi:hypothetical protein
LPALRRVRIAPYHPAERLLQSDEWFYDLTTISNLRDYYYQFADPNPDTPTIAGTPAVEFVPYQYLLLRCERRGDTYLLTGLTAWASGMAREAQFSGYHEIAPHRFRPQQIVIWNNGSSRTELRFQQWRFDVAGPELFTSTALETRSLPLRGAEGEG